MKFARPEMLFLMWTVPIFWMVFVYGMRKRRKILSGFASERGLTAIAPNTQSDWRRLKAGLLLITLVFIGAALAGPLYGYRWQEIEQKGVDIIVALDCSRSMLATDVQPTRLDRAKRKIYDLLTVLKGDRIGLVAFSGTAFLQCPLTIDYEAFHLFLNALTPDYLPVHGTDLGEAVQASIAGFDPKSHSEKAVILITDGEHTGDSDPIKAAEQAKQAGIKLFCIGVGSDQGVPVPDPQGGFKKDKSGKIVLSKLDEELLKKMAVLTGGAYVRSVAGDMDLEMIYTKEIREKMEASTLSGGRKQIWEDRYQWFLVIAILTLAAELFIPSVRKRSNAGALEQGICWFLLAVALSGSTPVLAGNIQDGLKAYENGDYDAALKHFIDEQLEHPDNPEILYNIGNAYYKKGDYESAEKSYKAALKASDHSLKHKTYYNLGNTNFRQKKYEDAVSNFDESLKLDPNDTQAKENLEFVKQVMAKLKEEEQKKPAQDSNKSDQHSGPKSSDEPKGQSESAGKDDSQNPSGESPQGDKSGQKDSQRPEFGKEMDENQHPQDSGKQAVSGGKKNEQPEDGKSAESPRNEAKEIWAKPGDHKPEGSEKVSQAERILNRLQDQPGKAMMPSYGKKRIERDW